MRYILFFMLAGLASCVRSTSEEPPGQMGYAPIYASAQSANNISVETARPTQKAGKIYAWSNYLFQVEQGEGIHIIDNTNPQQAQKISFLKIPFCTELSVSSNYLYTNNVADLVVFDLSNISSPQLVNRKENVFPEMVSNYPPFPGVFFECVDPSKGVVVGWEQKQLESPKCRR